ncbi:tRNase Z TRZ3, mitochondrial-like isoform X2 [Prosopis cineraria]|uniref:tRNase Z TRZ3, mitochondrial-like isoform X2 n=1 Tax=Prosopis cineraria TaxID=364024 RepID=UPI0024108309|nr:tRNase Z TRZ3, mitochondrial-like isoform X2 [Prosopis cineraria]
MPQPLTFRLFLPSLSPLTPYISSRLFFKPRTSQSLFTVLASSSSSSSRPQRNAPFRHLGRRSISSARESKVRDKGSAMENVDSVGFNKRRAEGRDSSALPKKNLQLKVRKLNPVNTISYVQILGTGMDTQDTSPSVLLFFDNQRFIFNAGEGLQRFCTEHKIKLSKIDHIFLSRVCSETAGGLPGLLLTLAGMGEEGMTVNIWGPSDLKYLINAMGSFIPNAAMVHTRSFGPISSDEESTILGQNKFSDPIVLVDNEVVKISAIILQPNHSEDPPLVTSEYQLQERMSHSPEHLGSSNILKQPTGKPGDMSVLYICELPEIKGKFDPEKAKAFGLKPGPKYRELQLGNSVESDMQNIMVHPSDVMGPSVPGPIVLLVDCPTESHLEVLLSVQSLTTYYADSMGKSITCIIHLSPASIVSCSNYQKWMKKFGSTQHIIAGHERKNVEIPILQSSARITARLNYLCPQFFPAPGCWSLSNHNSSISDSFASKEDSISELRETITAENLLKFTLRPYAQLGLDRSLVPTTVRTSEIIEELLLEIPEVVDAAQHVSQLCLKSSQTKDNIPIGDHKMLVEEPWLCADGVPSCLENIRRDDLEIVLLGTGSSQPSKYRNVSSIYINLFSKGGLLLDCGEGTLGQLKRRYGVDGADDAVRALKCIWISHIHADHHTGLARILALRRDLLKGFPHEPLLVVGPRQLKRYLDAYHRLENLDMQFLDCRHTTVAALEAYEDGEPDKNDSQMTVPKIDSTLFAKGSRMQSYFKRPDSPIDKNVVYPVLKKLKRVMQEAGLESLISFPVVHCPQAFGVVLKAAERVNSLGKVIPGWKIVYSGDTRPCPELVEASRGATILIHEATFEDALLEEAISRNHSTTKEAVEVGDSANAYRIVLTHFSQRYPKIPVFDEAHMHKTCIAFDMMSINIADLPVLPRVLPYLKLLFRDEMIVDESDVVDVVTTAS